MTADDKKSKILERVRGLLAKADSTEFPEEADACRSKADELMLAYAIQEYELAALGGTDKPKPEVRQYDISWYYSAHREMRGSLFYVFRSLATHCRVLLGPSGHERVDGRWTYHINAVGLPADLDYLDLLFTSVWQQFSATMLPSWDPKLPVQQNVFRMKQAGYKWIRIAQAGGFHQYITADGKVKDGGLLIRMYKAECTAQGITPQGLQPQVYIRSFSEGFSYQLAQRLRNMRAAQERNDTDNRQALVVRDIIHDLKDYLYELFPELKPQPKHPDTCECKECKEARKPVKASKAQELAYDYSVLSQGRSAGDKVSLANRPSDRLGSRRGLPSA